MVGTILILTAVHSRFFAVAQNERLVAYQLHLNNLLINLSSGLYSLVDLMDLDPVMETASARPMA